LIQKKTEDFIYVRHSVVGQTLEFPWFRNLSHFLIQLAARVIHETDVVMDHHLFLDMEEEYYNEFQWP